MKLSHKLFSDSRFYLSCVIIGYLLVGLTLIQFYRYQINPDGISYLDISHLYLAGHLVSALNAYWSPLFSWLLVPFLALGLSGTVAAKCLLLLVGVTVVMLVYRLTREMQPQWTQRVFLILAAAVTLSWALAGYITPDLLVVALVLSYLVVILESGYLSKPNLAILAGVLGGVGYLTKSYFLAFFVLHFTGYHIWRAWRDPRRSQQWWRQLGLGLAACAVIMLPWAVAISLKYGHPTLGTSGSYNLALASPGGVHPMFVDGLLKPMVGAFSIWDDPSKLQVPSIHLGHLATLQYFAGQALLGAYATYQLALKFWVFSITIWTLLLILLFRRGASETFRAWSATVGSVILVYLLGYLPFAVDDRYLWPAWILTLIVAMALVDLAARLRWFDRRVLAVGVIVVALSLGLAVRATMLHRSEADIQFMLAGQLVRSMPHFSCGPVATTSDWEDSSYIAYYMECPYYGVLPPGRTVDWQRQLLTNKVKFVVEWQQVGQPSPTLAGYHVWQRIPSQNLVVLASQF